MVEVTATRTKSTDSSPLIIFTSWSKQSKSVLEKAVWIFFSVQRKWNRNDKSVWVSNKERAQRIESRKRKKESFVNAEGSYLLSGFPLVWVCSVSESCCGIWHSPELHLYTGVPACPAPSLFSSSGISLQHPKRVPIYFYLHFLSHLNTAHDVALNINRIKMKSRINDWRLGISLKKPNWENVFISVTFGSGPRPGQQNVIKTRQSL